MKLSSPEQDDFIQNTLVGPHQFEFGNANFHIVGETALFWPLYRVLIFADLHLEKASCYATRGQMLPPYDSIATLEMIAELANQYAAEAVICLGDNFHDDAGEGRLQGSAATLLAKMTARYDWTWIIGNHDPNVGASWGGRVEAEWEVGDIMFRHEAESGWSGPEISGHYHPKLRMTVRGRSVNRRAFVMSANKLIMPAFGTLTGGMEANDRVIHAALGWKDAQALVPLKHRLSRFALCPQTRAK